MRLWRLCASAHAATAFSGLGSKQYGGRWTPPGRAAVYTAQHLSTAILEMLVHMEPAHFGRAFVMIAAELPAAAPVETVDVAALPDDWRDHATHPELHRIGRDWLDRGASVALLTPSVVAPSDLNVILNPAHPDFASIELHEPAPFLFDPRLRSR